MSAFFNKVLLKLSVGCFCVSLIISLIFLLVKEDKTVFEIKPSVREKYSSHLFFKVKSIRGLSDTLNAIARQNHITRNSLAYLEVANDLVESRFCFAYSHYSYCNNPYMKILGDLIWDDLSAIVIPDDLMKYNHAACSQQSIVLMDLLMKNGFEVRKVGLSGHFCMEAKVGNQWYFFDPTKEPLMRNDTSARQFEGVKRSYMVSKYRNSEQKTVSKMFSTYTIGETNAFPAPKVVLLHRFAFFMLYFGPIVFGVFFFMIYKSKKNKGRTMESFLRKPKVYYAQ
jgi:hypothetical protein